MKYTIMPRATFEAFRRYLEVRSRLCADWASCPLCHYGWCGCGDLIDDKGSLTRYLCWVCLSLAEDDIPINDLEFAW